MLGLLNKNDKHHEKCLKFFQEVDAKYKKGEEVHAIIPLHLFIEVNINFRKKEKDKTWNSIPPCEIVRNPHFYPIDLTLLQRIATENLYDKFDKLKSADAIYAMICFLEKIPLVTLDDDFNKVKNIIEVKIL